LPATKQAVADSMQDIHRGYVTRGAAPWGTVPFLVLHSIYNLHCFINPVCLTTHGAAQFLTEINCHVLKVFYFQNVQWFQKKTFYTTVASVYRVS